MRAMGHVAVDRANGEVALRHAVARVRAGEVVGIFPEATISRSWELRPFRPGAAAVATWCQVPLVPGRVWGSQRILTVDGRFSLRRGTAVTILVGEPLHPAPDADPYAVTEQLRDRWTALLERGDRTPTPTSRATTPTAGGSPPHAAARRPRREEGLRLDEEGMRRADLAAEARILRSRQRSRVSPLAAPWAGDSVAHPHHRPHRRQRPLGHLVRPRVALVQHRRDVCRVAGEVGTAGPVPGQGLVDRLGDDLLEAPGRRRRRCCSATDSGDSSRKSPAMVRRLATSGRPLGSKVIRRSESVRAARIRAAVSSAVSRRLMTLPLLLLIFVPSVPSRSGTSLSRASGSGNTLCPAAYLRVEAAGDGARLLEVRQLVAADRDDPAVAEEDVGGLVHRVGEQQPRQRAPAGQGELVLDGRVAPQLRVGDERQERQHQLVEGRARRCA